MLQLTPGVVKKKKKKKAVTLADRRCGDAEQKLLSTKSRDAPQGFGLEAEV